MASKNIVQVKKNDINNNNIDKLSVDNVFLSVIGDDRTSESIIIYFKSVPNLEHLGKYLKSNDGDNKIKDRAVGRNEN